VLVTVLSACRCELAIMPKACLRHDAMFQEFKRVIAAAAGGHQGPSF
jgi:hypothetical protein